MKALPCLLFLACAPAMAQTIPENPNVKDANGKREGTWTVMYGSTGSTVGRKSLAVYYRIISYDANGKPTGTVNEFYLDATPRFTGTLMEDRPKDVLTGKAAWFNEKGFKECEGFFEQGKLRGQYIFYTGDGTSFTDPIEKLTATGASLSKSGKYNEALIAFEKAALRARFELEKDSESYLRILTDLSDAYSLSEKYEKSESLYKDIVYARYKKPGPASVEYAAALLGEAKVHAAQGKSSKASVSLFQVIGIREKALGKQYPEYASSILGIAAIYIQIGRYLYAEPLLVEAKNIFSQAPGKDHPDYYSTLTNLATVYYLLGQYSKSEVLFLEAKEISEKIYGKRDPSYATALYYLAKIHFVQQVDLTISEQAFKHVLTLREQILGKNHPDYAAVLQSLGVVYLWKGNYSLCESYYLQSKGILEKGNLQTSVQYGELLHVLSNLYMYLGNYTTAFSLANESKRIFELRLGTDHPQYAKLLDDYGTTYMGIGERYYSTAEDFFSMSKEINARVYGKNHIEYGNSLKNLASLYTRMGRFSEAEALYGQYSTILLANSGKDDQRYFTYLTEMFNFFWSMKNFAKAEDYLLQARELGGKIMNADHPSYTTVIANMALLYSAMEKWPEAEKANREVIDLKLTHIDNFFPSMSEREKASFIIVCQPYFRYFQNFCFIRYKDNPVVLGDLYNLKLATKGLLFQSSNRVRQRILASHDKRLIEKYNSWKSKKEWLAKVYQMQAKEKQERNLDDKRLEEELNTLEKEISLQSADFAKLKDRKRYSWEDVKKSLKTGEVAVEILNSAGMATGAVDYAYVALIVTPQTVAHPDVVILRNGGELDGKYLKYYRNAIKDNIPDNYSYDQYWKPLAEKIKKAKKVYFSPDGAYHQINLNTLYNPITGKYLADETDIQVVVSTKDLVTRNYTSPAKIKDVSLFGFPDFNNESSTTGDSTRSVELKLGNMSAVKTDSAQRFFDGENISELPGTKTEVETIETILKQKMVGTQAFVYKKANEAELKNLNNPQVLHIATHGFFLSDISPSGENQRGFLGMQSETISDNPMLRSGLLFAGAKNAFKPGAATNEGEDGILTAFEASNLNLDQTDLVVLSACETGLGVTNNGEGVYGLQRAFQEAGSKSVLMSLWKVSDDATQKLMTAFYENWLKGVSQREAFRLAQLELRKKYPAPLYWGAFVMIGD